MCGITAVISKHTLDLSGLEACAGLQRHRGPDHFGKSEHGQWAVYHNRLAIIDTSSKSDQPIEDDAALLCYNGEIYNFRELARESLAMPDAVSDVQVLFALLKKYGATVVPQLNGMFAFVFYDKASHRVLCARDRMGIKPLYYALCKQTFICTSEIKTAIAVLRQVNGFDSGAQLNQTFIDDTFALGFAESRNAPFAGIAALPCGTTASWSLDDSQVAIQRYFSIPEQITELHRTQTQPLAEKTLVDRLDEYLDRSVALHVRADVPVGVLCSGGVDSSLVTALARKHNPDLLFYHAYFSGAGNERPWAEKVARHLKLDLRCIEMDTARYLELLPQAIWHGDLPLYHPSDISLFEIANKAGMDGVKVLLCGEGADELFGGYPWHRTIKNTLVWNRALTTLGKLATLAQRALRVARVPRASGRDRLLGLAAGHYFYSAESWSDSAFRSAIVHNAAMYEENLALARAYDDHDSNPALAAGIAMNLNGHLSSLLHRNDRMGMMASIETRVPFLENGIIDFSLALDTRYKIRGGTGKYLLKKVAERYLPKSVVYRRKQGFPVPWEIYLRSCNPAIVKTGVLADRLAIKGESLLAMISGDPQLFFTAVSIEIWLRLFVAGEKPEAISKDLVA